MTWDEAVRKLREENGLCSQRRAVILLRPTGRVATQEQYDYVMEYARNTGIYYRHIEKIESRWDTYLHVQTGFSDTNPMFYFSSGPEGYGKFDLSYGYEHYYKVFSYGKYGKIDFE